MARAARAWSTRALVTAALIAAVTGCSSASPAVDARLPDAKAPAGGKGLSDATFWLSFELDTIDYDGAPAYPDELEGPYDGRVVTAGGGTVTEVPGADGSARAIEFPPRCEGSPACPHVILEIPPDPALDPGEADFEYGASVWLAPDQTTSGSNIVQKGRFATAGGLWKLQVDSDEGHASCVVRSESTLVSVRSSVSIADSSWHRVVCRRQGDEVSIAVDDTVDHVTADLGPVASRWPVRIGGPGVGPDDDQFHGRVDDVFLWVDPAA